MTTTLASPDISEFEAYLERESLHGLPEAVVPTCGERKRKRISTNDEYWEGVLQSEKERLLKDSEYYLTSVEAMMVGVPNDEDNVHTPMQVLNNSLAKEKGLPFAELNGGASGTQAYTFYYT